VSELWLILLQFLFRLGFGVAICMALTPSKLVTGGFYRVHLWMLMGFATFASLIAYTQSELVANAKGVLGLAIGIAIASYAGAVLWLYEKKSAGLTVLFLVAGMSLAAASLATNWPAQATSTGIALGMLDLVTGGMLLGVMLTAMLLGHWYLNTPNMQLAPLKMLIGVMVAAIVVRSVLSAIGIALHVGGSDPMSDAWWLFVALRWLSGLLGAAILAAMTWQTLKIPNTQSATGILYAGVILTFIGELTSQLLSVETLYPV